MRSFTYSVAFLSLAVGAPLFAGDIPTVPPAEVGMSAEKLAEVGKFMEKQVADKKIAGGSVLIARNGKIAFAHSYGVIDLETRKPVAADTIFRLYSMTKAITSAGVLNLVEAGKIQLDDPVSKYIPSFAKLQVAAKEGLRAPEREMTVKDLLLHTSGLTYGGGPDALREAYLKSKPLESANLEEMAEKLSHAPLAYDPGTDWIYSVSIDVLGRIIEIASEEPLDAFLKKTIFEPLGMKDTDFSVPAEKLDRFATNYTRTADGLRVTDSPAKSHFAKKTNFFSGGGGLVGTGNDYLRFLMMVQNGGEFNGARVLKPETVRLMFTNQLPAKAFPIRFGREMRHGTGFGFGFSVRTAVTTWDPDGRVGEYGWGGAASTHYWVSPKDKLIVITLEQIVPYQWDTEFGIKKMVYDSIIR